jgi:glycosyltransferase involved in cell wall biosynthesis
MRILHINTYDSNGGAAKAAYRLHQTLLENGIESNMFVAFKQKKEKEIIGYTSIFQKIISVFYRRINKLPLVFYSPKVYFSPSILGRNIVSVIEKINPDIVHLHWICGGFVKIEDLAKIKKLIVWTLYDDWAYTGGCHIKWDCEKYKYRCGSCPQLNSRWDNDLSRKVYFRKEKVYKEIKNFYIIGLSKWICSCASQSSVLKDRYIVNIPNPIDTEVFKPENKSEARETFLLPKQKKLILLSGLNYSDLNKGLSFVKEVLSNLEFQDVGLVMVGSKKGDM